MKRHLCLIILLALSAFSFAQSYGSLNVDQDSRIESLISKQRSLYRIDSSFSGYRIHVFMEIGNEALQNAEQVKKQFESAFPDIPIFIIDFKFFWDYFTCCTIFGIKFIYFICRIYRR